MSINMRIVVQRVKSARVCVDGKVTGEIKKGILAFVGFADGDTDSDLKYMESKLLRLRIFEDEDEKMNLDVKAVDGELLLVSQFTLYGDVRKGMRPSFISAAKPEIAGKLYDRFVEMIKQSGVKTETGEFQAMMDVALINDGPVTILLDSRKIF